MAQPDIDLEALSPEEQLQLLDRLWERIGRSPDLFPLTEPELREIDARSDELDRDLKAGRVASHGMRS